MVINKYWTREQLREVMDNFSADFKNKKYSEKIEYELWRKIRNVKTPIISYNNPVVNIFEGYNHTPENWEKIASFKINDWGFGRFLYDNYFKEEAQNNMSNISATNKSVPNIATKAYNTTSDITISGDTISSSILDSIRVDDYATSNGTIDSTRVDNYGNLCWSNGTAFNTYTTTTTSKVDSCDICHHKNKCDNCYYAKKTNENKNDEGEKTKMKGFNFDFGPCDNTVRLSMYGMAIQNVNGEWVSYNPDSNEIINVDVFNINDSGKYMYKIPVAIADVKIGDIVIHNRVPMFVTTVNKDGTFEVADVRAGEAKTVIPTRSPFGFNFITKIVSLFNNLTIPDKDNPFGNMWMFAMLSDDKDFDMKDMLMISLMNGNNDFIGNMNPMMLMLMMDDKNEKNNWLMPLVLMNSGMTGQSHSCQCTKSAV